MILTVLVYDCRSCDKERLEVDAVKATLTVWDDNLRPPLVEFVCVSCKQLNTREPCAEYVALLVTTNIRVAHVRAPDEMRDPKRQDPRPLTYEDLLDLALSLQKG